MNSKAIGEKLRLLRESKKLTQGEAAEALNITQPALSMYESGARIPRDEIKVRIAAFYGMAVESIFFAAEP